MNRPLAVARIQLVAWPTAIGWPLGILAIAFAVNLLVFAAIAGEPADATTGGQASIYVVFFVTYLQSVSQVFPFLSGLSVTRRAYFAGTALLVLAQSVLFALLLLLLLGVEIVSGGWGLGMDFFGIGYLRQENVVLQLAVYTVPFLAMGFLGMFLGVVFRRWGTNGMFALALLVLAVLGAVVALVTWRQAWPTVGRWFVDTPPLAMVAGWPLVLAVLLAALAYLGLRRTEP